MPTLAPKPPVQADRPAGARRLDRRGFCLRLAVLGTVAAIAAAGLDSEALVERVVDGLEPAMRVGLALSAGAAVLLWLAALLGAAAARGRDLGLPSTLPALAIGAGALASAALALSGLAAAGVVAAMASVGWLAVLPGGDAATSAAQPT